MTTRTQHLRPIVRAHKRRSVLPAYFDLNGKGLFLLVILGASLLGLLALAQAGRVVSVGYQLKDQQKAEQQLLWKQEKLLEEIARATDPQALEQWALEHSMEPLLLEDISFIPAARELPPATELVNPLAVRPK